MFSYACRFSARSHAAHTKLDQQAIKCPVTVSITHTATKSSVTNYRVGHKKQTLF